MVDPQSFMPRRIETSNVGGHEGELNSPPKLPLDSMGVPMFGGAQSDELGSDMKSFMTPNASVFTPQSTKKGTGNEDTFGLRIFGRAQTKKMGQGLSTIKTAEAKAKEALEEAKKQQEEEEKKRLEDEEAAYNEIESDHHGRIFIDYREPKPSHFPVSNRQ